MEIEQRLQTLGIAGKWQIIFSVIFFVSLKTFTVWRMLSIIYVGYRPPHHCKIPENSSLHQWIPVIDNETFSSCSMYDIDSSSNGSVLIPSNRTTNCNNGWTFDLEESGPTVVSKWDLVCDKAYLMQTSQTVLTIGQATGMLVTKVSDKFGRKTTLLASSFLLSLFGLLSAVVNRIEIYFFFKFLIGFFVEATIMGKIVYVTETFSSRTRLFYMFLDTGYWGLAAATLPLFAYLIGNWVYLEIFISIWSLIFLPFLIWWLPETIPWLYANDRLKKAEALLKRVAKYNKLNLKINDSQIVSNEMKSKVFEKETISKAKSNISTANKKEVETTNTKYSITLLVRNRYLRRHMSLGLIVLINNFSFYGVSYMSGSLSENRFFSGFLNAIIEVPACFIGYFVFKRYGRRNPIIISQFIATVPIFLCVFTTVFKEQIPHSANITLALNILFKLFITPSFSMLYYVGAELFPTNLRTQALGICSMIGRLGSIASTFSSLLIETHPIVLYSCYCALVLLGGIISLILPETGNKLIPTTIEEIEDWYDKQNIKITSL